jgi:hypothetical protein
MDACVQRPRLQRITLDVPAHRVQGLENASAYLCLYAVAYLEALVVQGRLGSMAYPEWGSGVCTRYSKGS